MFEFLHRFATLALIAIIVSGAPEGRVGYQEERQQNRNPTIRTEVAEVAVPVVVTDSNGHLVGGLKQEDFEIFDNGKPQPITGFSVIERGDHRTVGPPSLYSDSPSVLPRPEAAVRHYVLFVFDDLNLNPSDLMQSQKAATKLFEAPLPPSDIVEVLSTSGFDSGLTTDHLSLQKSIQSLKGHNFYGRLDTECPDIDYYQADLIENKNDPMALEAAIGDAMSCAHVASRSTAEQIVHQAVRRAISLGDQDFRASLSLLRTVIERTANLQGQRTLIIVSPGFLTPTEEATRMISDLLDTSHKMEVTINALDARGLYTTSLDSSERSSSILQNREREQNQRPSKAASENVLAVLTDGSGGTYFHNSNDLKSAMSELFRGPEFLYLISFSPQTKSNGRYHSLRVKVDRKDVMVRSRHGYVANKSSRNI